MTGRELRVWHYRRATSAMMSTVGTHSRRTKKASKRLADFHFAAATVLDHHPDCIGYDVEKDDATFPRPWSRRHKR